MYVCGFFFLEGGGVVRRLNYFNMFFVFSTIQMRFGFMVTNNSYIILTFYRPTFVPLTLTLHIANIKLRVWKFLLVFQKQSRINKPYINNLME